MAKVIEFYIPASFQKRVPSVPHSQRGKLIEFCPPVRGEGADGQQCCAIESNAPAALTLVPGADGSELGPAQRSSLKQ